VEYNPGIKLPTLSRFGAGNICPNTVIKPATGKQQIALATRMKEQSIRKDTLTGHFELMGLKVTTPFPSFEETGFPDELIRELEEKTGRKVIGNISASGTEIIKDLGMEHMKTGAIIVYTSSDSVLQIAAHEEVVPLDELYKICHIAREITLARPEWLVGRIIARPFVGTAPENFSRTPNRHDYAVKPFAKTALDYLKDSGYDVIAIGKINDIFDGEGITRAIRTKSNNHGMEESTKMLDEDFTGLCFTNLVDFDAVYGHRRNVLGYGQSLEEFDVQLSGFISRMHDDDLLMVTADHGNDPVHHGTNHTREYPPLFIYHNHIKPGTIGLQPSFASVGKTICANFRIREPELGLNLMKRILKK
jgi:phosphopentomutase